MIFKALNISLTPTHIIDEKRFKVESSIAHKRTKNYVGNQPPEYRQELRCKICGVRMDTFQKICSHIKKSHGIDLKDYVAYYYYGGEYPKCACGCGQPTSWVRGLGYFARYKRFHNYNYNHKNKENVNDGR